MMADIEAKFSRHLHNKGVSLAEQTYMDFTLGEAGLEQARSTQRMMSNWLSNASPCWRSSLISRKRSLTMAHHEK